MANNGAPRPDNHVIVLFGASGDLAKRKLLPGLFHLHAAGLLPREYRVTGCSPPSFAMTTEQFQSHAEQACDDFCITKPTDPSWPSFAERLSFAAVEPGNTSPLADAIQRAEKEIGGSPRRLYHLAVPPAAFTSVVGTLGEARLVTAETRAIIEKPFDTGLASARALNQAVLAVFGRALRTRVVGPGVGRQADRAVPVAPAGAPRLGAGGAQPDLPRAGPRSDKWDITHPQLRSRASEIR